MKNMAHSGIKNRGRQSRPGCSNRSKCRRLRSTSPQRGCQDALILERAGRPVQCRQRRGAAANISSSSRRLVTPTTATIHLRPRQDKAKAAASGVDLAAAMRSRTRPQQRARHRAVFPAAVSMNNRPCRNRERAWISTPSSFSRASDPSCSSRWSSRLNGQLHDVGAETPRPAPRDHRRHRRRCRWRRPRLRPSDACSARHSSSPSGPRRSDTAWTSSTSTRPRTSDRLAGARNHGRDAVFHADGLADDAEGAGVALRQNLLRPCRNWRPCPERRCRLSAARASMALHFGQRHLADLCWRRHRPGRTGPCRGPAGARGRTRDAPWRWTSGRHPARAHMTEGTQAIRRIGAPFPVGQFGRHRLLEALAVGGEALADAGDHRRDLVRQPAMAGVIFLAGAVQIQMQFDRCWRSSDAPPARSRPANANDRTSRSWRRSRGGWWRWPRGWTAPAAKDRPRRNAAP